jgi:hypothetical protein
MFTGKWSFPLNQNGPIQGFNDQGIEYFLGNPIESLAKEIIQNSIDAGIDDIDRPVKVVFNMFYLKTSDLPQIDSLKEFYRKAILSWPKDDNVVAFCERALEILNAKEIQCLRISDFNTRGITGSLIQNQSSAWFNLTKGSGSTEKIGTAGGSKGIGKNASFANSQLRLVFYSTNDSEGTQATQGLLKLVSLKGLSSKSANEQTVGPIYFGNENEHTPLATYHSIDVGFERKSSDYGSDIFIIGFSPNSENWDIKIIEKTLLNFMYAIHLNRLEVQVQGFTLSQKTYLSFLDEYKHKKAYKDIHSMAAVLNSPHTISTSLEIPELGNYEVKVLKMNENEASKKCWYIRKPWMMITNVKPSYLPLLPFTSLVIIKNDKLNNYLRKLESAKHDSWEIERAGSLQNKNKAEFVLKNITQNIVEAIKRAFNMTASTSITPQGTEVIIEDEGMEIKEEKEVINSKKPIIEIKKTRMLKSAQKRINNEDKLIYNPETGKLEPSKNGDFEFEDDSNSRSSVTKNKKKKINPGKDFELLDGDDKYFLLDANEKIEAKIIVQNFALRLYKIIFKQNNEFLKFSIKINEVDSEGLPYFLKLTKAFYQGEKLRITNNHIFFDFGVPSGDVEIEIEVVNKKYFTSEVLFYGIKK